MRMKMLTFGFGVITGATLLVSLPYVKKMVASIKNKLDQEIHATNKKISRSERLKDEIIDAASEIENNIEDLVDDILYELNQIDLKGISPKAKKSFNTMKSHIISLKNELLK